MPASTGKRRWRKTDVSHILNALSKKSTIDELTKEGAVDDAFEEDVVGRLPSRLGTKLERIATIKARTHKKERELIERFEAAKASRQVKKEVLRKNKDLWGSSLLAGAVPAPVTKRHEEMPAVIPPKHGTSANPEKGEWLDNLAEQAAVAREFYEAKRTGLEAESVDDEASSADEKAEPETTSGCEEVKEEIQDDVDELFNIHYPTAVPVAKKRKNQQQRHVALLRRKRADIKALPKILSEVDVQIAQAENTRAYREKLRIEHARLIAQGVLPTGQITIGKKKYIESGSDVILPEELKKAEGSFRKLHLPPTNSALRDRAASFVKRGMVEILQTRVCKKLKTKAKSRIRTN